MRNRDLPYRGVTFGTSPPPVALPPSHPAGRSASAAAAPEAIAVTVSTEGQGPIFFASGWEIPKAPA
ncbi:MAG: hypothetical protein JSS97_03420 [Actinobacteria bacterium]|nr:hypothetical protein [Actinomycetota bacterium]